MYRSRNFASLPRPWSSSSRMGEKGIRVIWRHNIVSLLFPPWNIYSNAKSIFISTHKFTHSKPKAKKKAPIRNAKAAARKKKKNYDILLWYISLPSVIIMNYLSLLSFLNISNDASVHKFSSQKSHTNTRSIVICKS